MYDRHISDWDNAYANGIHIVGGDQWGDIWQQRSEQFRLAKAEAQRAYLDVPYGEKPRNIYDLFMPEGEAKGLVIFIHGGFWTETDKSYWSYLANGSVEHGYAVAMPSYTLSLRRYYRTLRQKSHGPLNMPQQKYRDLSILRGILPVGSSPAG